MGKKRRKGVRAALFPASSLVELVENGLQAVSGIDRNRITMNPPDHVHDSLALDGRDGSTGEWDYLLGIDEQHRPVIGVEVHPATNGEVASVIAKQQRTVLALRPHMDVTNIRRWIWIASKSDTVSR